MLGTVIDRVKYTRTLTYWFYSFQALKQFSSTQHNTINTLIQVFFYSKFWDEKPEISLEKQLKIMQILIHILLRYVAQNNILCNTILHIFRTCRYIIKYPILMNELSSMDFCLYRMKWRLEDEISAKIVIA